MLDWIVKNISQRPTASRLYFLLPRREPVSEDKAKNTTSLFSPFSPLSLCNSPAVWSHLTSYREKINHQLMRWGCEKCERSNLEAPIRVYSCGPPVSITGWSQVQGGGKGMQDDSRSGGRQEKREEGKRSSWADKEAFPALPMRANAGLNSHGERTME